MSEELKARVEQIRRAHASAVPKAENPAWVNTYNDLSAVLRYVDELTTWISVAGCGDGEDCTACDRPNAGVAPQDGGNEQAPQNAPEFLGHWLATKSGYPNWQDYFEAGRKAALTSNKAAARLLALLLKHGVNPRAIEDKS